MTFLSIYVHFKFMHNLERVGVFINLSSKPCSLFFPDTRSSGCSQAHQVS